MLDFEARMLSGEPFTMEELKHAFSNSGGEARKIDFHPVYTAHAASSPDWLRAQRPCLENPNMVTLGLRLARA
jgi:hypothetical protein